MFILFFVCIILHLFFFLFSFECKIEESGQFSLSRGGLIKLSNGAIMLCFVFFGEIYDNVKNQRSKNKDSKLPKISCQLSNTRMFSNYLEIQTQVFFVI